MKCGGLGYNFICFFLLCGFMSSLMYGYLVSV